MPTRMSVFRTRSSPRWKFRAGRTYATGAVCFDRLRQRRQARVREWAKGLERLALRAPPASEAVEDHELSGRLRTALAAIPRQQAQVFCLHVLEEWTYQEIATEMAISVTAVGVLIHRARKRLRHLLMPKTEISDETGRGLTPSRAPATPQEELP
jgi:RNA polymerase sigma-70 factor (ECF subfamily)